MHWAMIQYWNFYFFIKIERNSFIHFKKLVITVSILLVYYLSYMNVEQHSWDNWAVYMYTQYKHILVMTLCSLWYFIFILFIVLNVRAICFHVTCVIATAVKALNCKQINTKKYTKQKFRAELELKK